MLRRAVHVGGMMLLFVSGCRDAGVLTPGTEAPADTNIFQRSISEPVTALGGNVISGSAFVGQVYVAFAAGDLPDARSVRISNISQGVIGTTEYPVIDGALDPVAISAAVGDILELRVTTVDGRIALMRAAVPTKRPPRVIRTNPPRGRADVALNSRIRVVFSEPMEASSITPSTMQLSLAGEVVEGSFVFDGPPTLAAEFVPAQPLASSTNYSLRITSGVRDLSGDGLEEPVSVEFSTIAEVPTAASLEVHAVTSGVDHDENGYVASITAAGFHSRDALSIEGELRKTLSAGTYSVTLEDIALNCTVTGGITRQVNLAPGMTAAVSFAVVCFPGPGSPVNTQPIAFVSERDGNPEIYVVHLDGTGLVRLTFNQANDTDPAWSPDGTRIAFSSDRSGVQEIYIMNADGSAVVRRTNTGYAASPAWSPDGTKIAFESICQGDGCIKVISAEDDGKEAIRLGNPRGMNAQPAWSPDGTEIAFVSDWVAFDFVYDVYVTKVDGSATRQVTNGFGSGPVRPGGQIPITFYLHPEYSPEGKLAVLSYSPHLGTQSDPPFIDTVKVVVMDDYGSEVRVVADAGYTSRFAEAWPRSISWSTVYGDRIALTVGSCTGEYGQNCTHSIVIAYANYRSQYVVIPNGHSPAWRNVPGDPCEGCWDYLRGPARGSKLQ